MLDENRQQVIGLLAGGKCVNGLSESLELG